MAKSSSTPTFDEFWTAYPVHKDRKRAEQAWQRLTAGDRRAALAALPGYIADCQQNGIKYKYAQGWLNGRRWEDEPSPAAAVPVAAVPVASSTGESHSGMETW